MPEFAMVQNIGVSYYTAWLIADAINAGLSIATIIAIVSGVASWIGVFYSAIRKKIWELGMSAAVFW
ncbi:hypothetical protein [Carboxydocella sp. ULO1]|uniref:hypothetical protein n=1 Tax=Carboxydocella sp. ULO1 TaxID=1926599 RepID=UPI0009ADE510|nr:hypothetical protein [Carboxydocella sp. ULO1]GAW27892.1 hypothetical protein ULO1_04620 [Carboxydocella sp. ULO1]